MVVDAPGDHAPVRPASRDRRDPRHVPLGAGAVLSARHDDGRAPPGRAGGGRPEARARRLLARQTGHRSTRAMRGQYCTFVARLLTAAPQVRDVVIWNEPNSPTFWRPQFDAERRERRAAPRTSGCSPTAGTRSTRAARRERDRRLVAARQRRSGGRPALALAGALVRGARPRPTATSGRDRPIFDTVGHNPYPNTSAEPPWARHAGGTIGEGDYAKLVSHR